VHPAYHQARSLLTAFLYRGRRTPVPGATQRGFTLIELSVVVLVIALLLGSILVPLTTQALQRQNADAIRRLEEIKEILIGHALQTAGNLPCPDKTGGGGSGTANDGVEDVEAGGTCTVAEGNLPWVSLGTPSNDPWGNRYRYRVTGAFAQRAPAARFTLSSTGDMTVCSSSSSCPGTSTIAASIPAVILSHGRNGRGGFNANTNTQNAPPPVSEANENENADGDAIFVLKPISAQGSTGGEFDDLVGWLSANLLFARMVAGGQLP